MAPSSSARRGATSRALLAIVTTALLAPVLPAQLPDLQPGRNFPLVTDAFGANVSEQIDVGDLDRDGDLDVVVGNGGDGASAPNLVYINQGGAQGGTEGSFADETLLRLDGVPPGKTRDVDLVDWDGDWDLDLFEANSGNSINGGQVARAHRNLGGAQGGSIGFFEEVSDTFWGTLVSVPASQEIGVVDGEGPWKEISCDCDFGDLDDDGDLDLFMSTYGVNMQGNRDSRIFLNDGLGRFDELWPWADPAADTKLHTREIDLADLDGDFDLDVIAASRDSQARIYRNDLVDGAWGAVPFTDVTQTALLDTGAGQAGSFADNYETEFADVDGDGDFDLWMANYTNWSDELLVNNGDLTFSTSPLIKGDLVVDDLDIDFIDYDSDGDLDVFAAVFGGTNWIYQSSLADGLPVGEGLYHRTGGTLGQAPAPETPELGNSGTTIDAEVADVDGDGDPDLLLANDNQQQNRLWINALGVPDTHAPTFAAITVQGDKADGSDTAVHAAVRDNHPDYEIAFHDVDLVYTVDGGPETCVRMRHQGGQQFLGVIPGALDGSIAYRVEASDAMGNTGISGTTTYRQTAGGAPLWQNLGCGTDGAGGVPYLELAGTQLGGDPVTLSLVDGPPDALLLAWLSFASTPLPALGGTVHAHPFAVQVLAATDAGGMLHASATWPTGVPLGTDTFWQVIAADPSTLHGLVLSNAVRGISP